MKNSLNQSMCLHFEKMENVLEKYCCGKNTHKIHFVYVLAACAIVLSFVVVDYSSIFLGILIANNVLALL